MIAYLKGKVKEKKEKYIILEIGNIGFRIFLSSLFLEKIKVNEEIKIYTFLYSREDTLELYGFSNEEELNFFEYLISVPGIGPKSAISILSLAPPEKLKEAVQQNRVELLTKVSGVGRKTAERIILELKNKFKEEQLEESLDEEVLDALIKLGYSLREARKVIREIPPEITKLEEKVKYALKLLSQ